MIVEKNAQSNFSKLLLAGLITLASSSMMQNSNLVIQGLDDASTFFEIPANDEYFSIVGNNIVSMKSDSIIQEQYISPIAEWQTVFRNLIGENVLEVEDTDKYFSFLECLREKEEYEDFLRLTIGQNNINDIRALLLFYAAYDELTVSGVEEAFVLSILEGKDLMLQELALNCLLAWDIANDLERLKTIRISNVYLQRDLDEFIARKTIK